MMEPSQCHMGRQKCVELLVYDHIHALMCIAFPEIMFFMLSPANTAHSGVEIKQRSTNIPGSPLPVYVQWVDPVWHQSLLPWSFGASKSFHRGTGSVEHAARICFTQYMSLIFVAAVEDHLIDREQIARPSGPFPNTFVMNKHLTTALRCLVFH